MQIRSHLKAKTPVVSTSRATLHLMVIDSIRGKLACVMVEKEMKVHKICHIVARSRWIWWNDIYGLESWVEWHGVYTELIVGHFFLFSFLEDAAQSISGAEAYVVPWKRVSELLLGWVFDRGKFKKSCLSYLISVLFIANESAVFTGWEKVERSLNLTSVY